MPRHSRKRNGELRLFLAIYPPESVVGLLLKKLRSLDGLPPYRETIPQQVHLTLHFMGNVHPRDIDQVIESIDRAKKGIYQFEMDVERLIAYPRQKHDTHRPSLSSHPPTAPTARTHRAVLPRLLVAEMNQPGYLLELHHRLVQRLSIHPRPHSNDRYSPHLTLCRFRPFRMSEYPIADHDWIHGGVDLDHDDGDAPLSFTVDGFSLMKSTLNRNGAIHERIADWPLIEQN